MAPDENPNTSDWERALCSSDLPWRARLVALTIQATSPTTPTSTATLAQACRMSWNTTNKYLLTLEACGWLMRERVGKHTRYWLTQPEQVRR